MKKGLEKLRKGIRWSGIISIIIGVLMLFVPTITASFAVILLSMGLIVTGLTYISATFKGSEYEEEHKTSRLGHCALGIFYFIIGIMLLTDFSVSTTFLFIIVGSFVGALWLVEGFISLTTLEYADTKIFGAILSCISIIAGVSLLLSPLWGGLALWTILGIESIIIGVIKVVHSYRWK